MSENPTIPIGASGSGDHERTRTLASGVGASLALPAQFGHYRILRAIGEGGMGTVYEAEQEKPRRTVALKVIRPGFASPHALRRFEQESQVLGHLQHPGIAQIYEAGTTDAGYGPQPFFAMEFIRGRTLLEHAEAARLGTRARLELFVKVCDAVQHAHEKSIIHRDLKPGNIMVDASGQPKVLDFGVARATDSDLQATMQTDVGQLVGTLPYMSPEQVAADPSLLDLRSDVYALGVVLYELLAGQRPYAIDKMMLHEAVRVIREEDPAPLSSIDKSLRGDVETIVARALEKEKERRYASAADLAADIRRFLSHQPIVARRPSATYQLGKFARRNRVLMGGVVTVFVVMAVGAGLSTWQAVRATRAEQLARTNEATARSEAERAQREADRAKQEALKAEAVNMFLRDMLGSANPKNVTREDLVKGREVTVVQVLAEAVKRLDAGTLKDQPVIEAAVRQTIGNTYKDLGEYSAAETNLRIALDIRGNVLGEDHAEVAESLDGLAGLLSIQGKLSEAEPLSRQALAIRVKAFGEEHPDVAKSLNNLAELLASEGKAEEAEAMYRRALAMERALLGQEHRDVATTLHNLATLLQSQGRPAEAEPLFREALAMRRALVGDEHPDVASTLHSLAFLLKAQGQLGEAEGVMREVVAIRRKQMGSDHSFLAASLTNLAVILRDEGKLADAEPLIREALAIQRKALGADHADVGASLYNLAKLLQAQGRLADAEPIAREALANHRRVLPANHPTLAAVMCGLGSVLTDLGKADEAEPMLREAMGILDNSLPKGDWQRAQAKSLLGGAILGQGKFAEAEPFLLEGSVALMDNPGVSADRRQRAIERVIRLYEAWDAAEPGAGRAEKATEWRTRLVAEGSRAK